MIDPAFLHTALALATAFALGVLIGLERQYRQRTAGLRTNVLVAVGAAAFVDLGARVLGPEGVTRITAYVVSGIGFLGAGSILLRGDSVRGLTTAASIWVTAAVGAAAGAGLPVLALATTALYGVLMYGLGPLTRLAGRFRPHVFALRVTYDDGRGVLRRVIDLATARGFSVEELASSRDEGDAEDPRVEVTLTLAGRGDVTALSATLADIDGVRGVRTGFSPEE